MPINLDSLFPGAILHYIPVLDSTNQYAAELLSKSQPAEGCVIISDFQTHGRGQYGRTWLSQSTKNLLFSIIIKPVFLPIIQQFVISQIVACSLINAIKEQINSNDVFIKWPNDIILKEKKVAGILIQNQLLGQKIQSSIVGIGVNVNQTYFPDSILATSIAQYLKQEIDRFELFNRILVKFQEAYSAYKSTNNRIIILKEYNNLLYKRNEQIRYHNDEEIKSGIVLNVNNTGELNIRENGKLKSYKFGEIKWML